jgi:alpha,alpha-trehalase
MDAVVAIVAALSRSAGAFCTSPIYCTGPLLDTIQRAGLFNDSKTFVDMPLRAPEQVILAAFAALGHGPLSRAQLANFVEQYFYPAGTDILEMSPIDWKPNPSFLLDIVDPELNRFASAIHRKWQDLTRRWNPTVVSSHIVVENPFVVAGGRFREYYYWFVFRLGSDSPLPPPPPTVTDVLLTIFFFS